MQYSQIRDSLRTGDICLHSHTGFIPHLIKKITGSPISHISMVVVLNGVVMELESTWDKVANGVRLSNMGYNMANMEKGSRVWVRQYSGSWNIELDYVFRRFYPLCKNKHYELNYVSMILAAYKLNWFSDTKTVFCSELIAWFLQYAGIIDKKLVSDNWTPADFSVERGTLDNHVIIGSFAQETEIVKG